jgi:hypothetical protein
VSKDKSKEAAVTPREDLNAYDNVVRSNHASIIPSADDELDEILINYYNSVHEIPMQRELREPWLNSSTQKLLKAAINRLYVPRQKVVEAIGEDDELECDCGSDSCGDYMGSACKNNLRAEIREKLGLDK